jgi:predicted nucleic acid-binding protein
VYVLDTFALMAYFQDEPAAPRVADLFRDATVGQTALAMSLVNWGEVLYNVERKRGLVGVAEAIWIIDGLPVRLMEVTRSLARRAARLKAAHPLSYADCFAAALAGELGAAVVTGDPEFRGVEGEIQIEWLPQRPRP